MKVNFTKKTALTALVTLSTASVYFAQNVKDSLPEKSKDIKEVVITGVADIAKDRKTPVAVSNIKEAQIVQKLGNQEFPEILNTTPSVYTTKSGGGFGDSRITIRGFDQENIAVLINGVPINDMENGRVYWSNWAGLSDVTSDMQVQRGLGSSKLAIASVGGTINILTKAADKRQMGKVMVGIGNDGYLKSLFSYNTGKTDKGWSSSFLMSRTAGSTYADGTKYEGYNYYFALGFQPNKQHDFQFTITGAPQWHNQRSSSVKISDAIKYGGTEDTPNRRYNADWGYITGSDGIAREYSFRKNYFHKPILSLNWDWKISRTSKLATVLYASFGRGGGTGDLGGAWTGNFKLDSKKGTYSPIMTYASTFRNTQGLYDFDAIMAYNQGYDMSQYGVALNPTPYNAGAYQNVIAPDGSTVRVTSGILRRASINSHNWYGILSNFSNKINDNLRFSVGIDSRYYKGFHYRVISDFLGNNSYTDSSNKNIKAPNIISNSFSTAPKWNAFGTKVDPVKDRIIYSNDSVVKWIGGFGQLEYSNENLSAFVQGSISDQGFQRIDSFMLQGDTSKGTDTTTKTKYLIGYNIKGGSNLNIDRNNNIFVNIGYYSRQPFFEAVYLNNTNNVNPELKNEKIFSIEFGYGFRSSIFNANLNLYRTTWNDQFRRVSWNDNSGARFTANLLGLNEIHQGLEFDFDAKPTKIIHFNGMFSIGDYHYNNNPTAYALDDQTNQVISKNTLEIKNSKVGNKAQMTASLGTSIRPTNWFSFNATYRYADNLYSNYDPTRGGEAIKLPDYGLLDLGANLKWKLTARQEFVLNANVYNVLDKVYISDMYTNIAADADASKNWNGINKNNLVYFGFGRTWAASLSFTF
ncbi:TonB-dependent receptor [Riemerella columbipharyngis]|uniref:TonB-dependent Receptor Plug Domain n=1 Tax=Riemerella columbipharyngis TaxID=1071918 RepID=A0A1G7A8E1_9FLAO|nr:TonB-dependent receptor plug domain-containing protein [Riemerella columbipharyngis]SDE10933.1 TonB-dependent Receptor Plug Domain [Riemerella columbipharyngis]